MGLSRRAARKEQTRRRGVLGSHQRCWVWGRRAVVEILQAGRWPVLELHLADRLPADEAESARQLAASVDVVAEPIERLAQLCGSQEHQGYVARMPPFPYDDAAALAGSPGASLWLLLDALQDSYNFGAVLRSAEVFGADGVFVGPSRQAEVNSLVARSSAGAVNHVRIAKAPDLVELAARLRRQGVRLVAASEKSPRPVHACDLNVPTALVIGNEGTGIRPELLAACDEHVTIPQRGRVGSLNAAVAAGILLYEARRQRDAQTDPGEREA
jgi:23S rRNA (guanosine2251-2'-O)-methyltransferase